MNLMKHLHQSPDKWCIAIAEDIMKELLAERNERVEKAHREGKEYLDDEAEEEKKDRSQVFHSG